MGENIDSLSSIFIQNPVVQNRTNMGPVSFQLTVNWLPVAFLLSFNSSLMIWQLLLIQEENLFYLPMGHR